MKYLVFIFACLAVAIVILSYCKSPNKKGNGIDKNVVTNLSTNIAIEIAEARLCQVYGERVLRQRPWKIKYIGDNILITGTLHRDGESNRKGGVAQISINRHDGRIIKLTHGK